MKKLLIAISLVTLSGAASAAPQTFLIGDGNWTEQWTSNISSTSASTNVWDNGETQLPGTQQVGPSVNPAPWYDSGFVVWDPLAPGNEMDGTYSGSIEYNNVTGVVTGGSLIVTGKIGNQVVVGPNTWWSHEYTNLVIDFAAGTAVNSNYECRETFTGPATCDPDVASPAPDVFTPIAGVGDGTAYLGATFDGTNLVVYREGFDAGPPSNGGTDGLPEHVRPHGRADSGCCMADAEWFGRARRICSPSRSGCGQLNSE